MNKAKKVTNFKISNKWIMLGLILVGLIIVLVAMFVTEYTINNVSAEKAFETKIEEGWVEVSEEDFLKHFTTFDLKEDKIVYPTTTITGKATISLKAEFDNSISKKDRYLNETTSLTVYAKYGADWIGFYSQEASFSSYTIGSTNATTRTINNFDKLFPASKFLFIRIEHPELFSLIKWTNNGTTYYTLLSLDHTEYKK